MWEHTPNSLHSFLSVKHPKNHMTHNANTKRLRVVKRHMKNEARVPWHLLRPLDVKPGLQEQKESVPLTTQWASSPSPHTVLLLWQSFSTVSAGKETGSRRSEGEHCQCDKFPVAQHTFLTAVDFIRAIVLTVVKVVAAQNWADATAVRAPELVLLARWFGGTPFWKRTRVTEKLFLTCYMWKINHNKSLTSNCKTIRSFYLTLQYVTKTLPSLSIQ